MPFYDRSDLIEQAVGVDHDRVGRRGTLLLEQGGFGCERPGATGFGEMGAQSTFDFDGIGGKRKAEVGGEPGGKIAAPPSAA